MKRVLLSKLTRLKTKHCEEFPCYKYVMVVFVTCAKKGDYRQVNFWHNNSLSRMKNENMSYLEFERPRKLRGKDYRWRRGCHSEYFFLEKGRFF